MYLYIDAKQKAKNTGLEKSNPFIILQGNYYAKAFSLCCLIKQLSTKESFFLISELVIKNRHVLILKKAGNAGTLGAQGD